MNYLPQARTGEIVVQDLGAELLVYDLQSHKAYALNATAKIVFESCDGNTLYDELKRRSQFTDELIRFTLDKLKANNLLIDYENDHFANLSRREVVKKLGLASAITLPVIASLVAPIAVHAASGARQANNSTCTTSNSGSSTECQSGYCVRTNPGNTLRCCAGDGVNYESGVSVSSNLYSNAGGASCASDAQRIADSRCCSGQATVTRCVQDNPNQITYNYTCR